MPETSADNDTLRICRSCGQSFELPERRPRLLSACPHCGKSIASLAGGLRSNASAAMFAFLSLLILIPGLLLPFMTATTLGTEKSYSLISGITTMFGDGHLFIPIILLLFSVVFPIIKLVLILAATSALIPLGGPARHLLARVAVLTGKYSMLDIMVVALLIVIVKLEGMAAVAPRIGTGFFCVSVILAMLAGLCTRTGRDDAITTKKKTVQPRGA